MKYIFLIISVSVSMTLCSQTKLYFYYDNNSQVTGYKAGDNFNRSFVYDKTGNLLEKNNEVPVSFISDDKVETTAELFPNPFHSIIEIRYPTYVSITDLHVFDILSKEIEVDVSISQNNAQVLFPGTATKGIYICRVKTDDGTIRYFRCIMQ